MIEDNGFAANEEINLESANGSVLPTTPEEPLKDAEWCFQFFDNEPVVFGWSAEGEVPGNLTFELKPVVSEGMNFTQNGMDPRYLQGGLKLLRVSGLWSTNKKMLPKTQSLHQALSQDVSTECESVDR